MLELSRPLGRKQVILFEPGAFEPCTHESPDPDKNHIADSTFDTIFLPKNAAVTSNRSQSCVADSDCALLDDLRDCLGPEGVDSENGICFDPIAVSGNPHAVFGVLISCSPHHLPSFEYAASSQLGSQAVTTRLESLERITLQHSLASSNTPLFLCFVLVAFLALLFKYQGKTIFFFLSRTTLNLNIQCFFQDPSWCHSNQAQRSTGLFV